ncbi:MAG: hypothetical protein M3024_00875, partial [Candidatus Dormibacteraeota bacterium]|nr:hypothetical protein [Candidatus Dormibacteraeota bacterium]
PGACAAILLMDGGRWRHALALVGAGAAGFLIFVLYGAIIDWHNFVLGFQAQAGYRDGVVSGLTFLAAPAGVNRSLHDGWWLLGWIGIGALGFSTERRHQWYVAWPAVAYLLAMVVMVGSAPAGQYGWYRWPVYPLVYLAAGWLAWEAVVRRSLPLLGLVLALGVATAVNWWLGGLRGSWQPSPYLLSLLLLAALLPVAVAAWRFREATTARWALYAGVAVLGVAMLGNAVESFFLADIFRRL